MIRRLRVLAAFFMVPLVLLSNPTSAAAASPGPWQQVQISMDVLGSNDWVGRQCTFNARHGGTAIEVGAAGYCTGLPDASPGGLQPGEAGSSFVLTFDGADASSSSCGATYGGTLGQHALNGTMRVAGSIPSGSATITGGSDPASCVVTEVCLRLMDSEYSCSSVTIEPGEDVPETGSCPHGFPGLVKTQWKNMGTNAQDPNQTNWRWSVKFTLTTEGVSTARWFVAFYPYPGWGGVNAAEMTTTNEFVLNSQVTRPTSQGPPPPPASYEAPMGYQFWSTPETWNTASSNWSAALTKATAVPTHKDAAFGGLTMPEHCRWYVGEKLVDIAGTETDAPFAATNVEVTPPEDPEPVVDVPDPVDEPSDDLGWLGMIWAVLQSIWGTIKSVLSAIKGLVAGIVSGIVNGVRSMLEGLFVPGDEYLEGKWDGVENKWASTTPAKYVDAVQGFSPGSVSGCGGLPLNVTLPGGVAVEQNIGAACGGAMASAAGVVRAALTAVMVVGGAFACVRAVGSGLGWNPGVGRGADA